MQYHPMKLFFYLLLSFSFPSIAQVDFDNYTSIKAIGLPPDDFSVETYEKVAEALYDKSAAHVGNHAEQYDFIKQSRYSIDDLLHSGTVTYGDVISNYIQDVAEKILASNPTLFSELRFYTIKSNNANAFSTDQGIIFVTTGLISRLSNEAQLAFILAHEISHYTANHVAESYKWEKNKNYDDDWIRDMSIYSKGNELNADKLGVKLYLAAGYSKDALNEVFDILARAHLPFLNEEITLDYFASDNMFLPSKLFSDSIYPIVSRESEDDSLSTHPNSQKRKFELENVINSISGTWGNEISFFGAETFELIRNCARFESVRDYILNSDYGSALYAIYSLESEFENSLFLNRMKAQSWLGIYEHGKNKPLDKQKIDDHIYEGPSANVYDMFNRLPRMALTTLALRHVYDIHQSNSTDKEVDAIYNSLLFSLRKDELFKIEDYKDANFSSAIAAFLTSTDSLKTEIDSSEYYLYGLSDILKDSLFMNRLDSSIDKENTGTFGIDFSTLISLEPMVISYSKDGLDMVRSEMLEKKFSKAIIQSAKFSGIEINQINSRSIANDNSSTYNKRSILYSWLRQLGSDEENPPFPVDYSELAQLKSEFNTSKVMFTFAAHTYQPDIKWIYVAMSAWLFPTFPIFAPVYVPLKMMTANHTSLLIVILDFETGKILLEKNYTYNEALSQHSLGARMYDILIELNSEQNN